MAKIFISLAIGFFIGYKNFLNGKMIKLNSKLQTLWLILLIFTMGMGIGSSRDILSIIHVIGLKAFAFAAACILGSVGVVYIISKFMDREDDIK